jgi:hypothetical protein
MESQQLNLTKQRQLTPLTKADVVMPALTLSNNGVDIPITKLASDKINLLVQVENPNVTTQATQHKITSTSTGNMTLNSTKTTF